MFDLNTDPNEIDSPLPVNPLITLDPVLNLGRLSGIHSPSSFWDEESQLALVIESAKIRLGQFSQSPQFQEGMELAFGSRIDVGVAQALVKDVLTGVSWPRIEVLPAEKFAPLGGFGVEVNTIYLRDDLLNPNPANFEKAVAVVLEEMGHYLDAWFNPHGDAPGDEGAILAKLVQGELMEDGELTALKGENDHGMVVVAPSQNILIEKASNEPGVFTVGEDGQLRFDLLADSGGYRGELAIVSLTGMEDLERGSSNFIQEAARRALSNSELGYLVFSDFTEGARFSGRLGEAELNYKGIRTFALTPSDEVVVMLVPNGTIQEVFDNPTIEGDKRPLFSIAAANPRGAEQFGQLRENRLTFGFEDLRRDFGSDRDFNDLIFQIQGISGSATLHSQLIVPHRAWENTTLGQQILNFWSPPQITAALLNDTGSKVADGMTMDVRIGGQVSDDTKVVSLQASLNGTEGLVDVSDLLQVDGSFVLEQQRLGQLNGGTLSDGEYSLILVATDGAGNLSQISVSFTLDTTAPTAIIANSLDTTSTVIEVSYSEAVSGLEVGNYTLTLGEEVIPVESVEEINSSLRQLNLGTRLNAGNYQLSITGVSDLAGNVINDTVVLDFTVIGASVEISPTSGSEMVSLNQNPVVRFGKKVDPTTVNENTFEIIANGEPVAGRIAVSSTREFATFFSDTALPASTSVRVTVLGDEIMGLDGVALDADGDGTPGGTLTADFSTLPLTQIEDTNVTGYVYDFLNLDEEGNNVPIVGATVRVDALPKVVAVTDSEGFFRLENVPAPLFAVHIDGGTTTNAPSGTSYATVGKIFESVPGQEVQLNHHGEIFDIFLPTMADGDIQELSATEDTEVGFGTAGVAQLQAMFPEVEGSTWELLEVTFPAGSAQDEAGNVATTATIIPVNPERLPAPLPPHLNPRLVISIQAPGATNFDVPAPVTFPNLEGLAPGAKCLLFSFNHDSGEWEVVGTGTVSEDGLSIVSDPGTGILAPGWHFVNEAGDGGGDPPPPPCDNSGTPNRQPPTVHDPVALNFIAGESATNFSTMSWSAPSGSSSSSRCKNDTEPFIKVSIEIDGPLDKFAKPVIDGVKLQTKTYTLEAGSGKTEKFGFQTKTYDELFGPGGFVNLTRDELYGAKIKITVEEQKANGDSTMDIFTYYQYRWVNVIYAEEAAQKAGRTAAFHRTLTDGFERTKNVNYDLPESEKTTFDVRLSVFDLGKPISGRGEAVWKFDPSSSVTYAGTINIEVDTPDSSSDIEVGEIVTQATSTAPTKIDLNLEGYKAELKVVLLTLERLEGPDEEILTADDVFKYRFVNGSILETSNQFKTHFAGFLPGDDYTDEQLNRKLTEEANALFEAVDSTYSAVNQGTGVTGYKIGKFSESDIKITWEDSFSDPTIGLNTTGMGRIIGGFAESDADKLRLERLLPSTVPISNAAKQWVLAESLNQRQINKANLSVGVNVDWTSQATFAQLVAQAVSHELAHTFCLSNAYFVDAQEVPSNVKPNDIMGFLGKYDDTPTAFEDSHIDLLRAALGMHSNGDKPLTEALQLYKKNLNLPNSQVGLIPVPDPNRRYPRIRVKFGNHSLFPRKVSTGPIAADGLGGANHTIDLVLTNSGNIVPLIINSITLADGAQGFSILAPETIDKNLAPREKTTLRIQFDPTKVGTFTDTLIISSNDELDPIYEIKLNGIGISPTPSPEVSISENSNNNFGGVPVEGETAHISEVVTITNHGAQPLTITGFRILEGEDAFTMTSSLDNPVSLNFGESFTFGDFKFDPNTVGLDRAIVEILTNAPHNPRFSLVGTSLDEVVYPEWRNDFIAVEFPELPNPFELRTVSDDAGIYKFFLPAETRYYVVIFDPVTGLVGSHGGNLPPSGGRVSFTGTMVFHGSYEEDSDGDGLPDDVEFAIGSSPNSSDTDKDGIDDFQEIQQGLDPLTDVGFPTGIIASLPLQGEAKAVVVEGDTGSESGQTAYVATGSHGLAIIDASKFNNPIIQGQLSLPGDATDVAVDTKLKIAAVATNSGGLQIVDISDPMVPTLRRTINFNANQVEIFDGIVYATAGTSLRAIDLLTGAELDNATLPGSGTVTGLAREGTKLYSYTSGSDTFSIIDITDPTESTILGQLNVRIASSEVGVFAANGVAYLAGSGMHTIDISDPNQPTLISMHISFLPLGM